MNYIDLVLIVLILLMIWVGYARGLIASLLSFIRIVISIPLAFFAANNYSERIYTDYFRASFNDAVLRRIESGSLNDIIASLQESVESMPTIIGNSVDLSFIKNADAATAAQQIMNNVIDPAAKIVFEILIFILTIVVIYVITWIVTSLLKKVFMKKNSPIKKTDKLLGAVLGALKAAVVVFALCAAGQYIAEHTAAGGGFTDQLKSSNIIDLINKFNPVIRF